MENKSIKDKILYWGGITLISSVVLGGSYYIYKSIFGSEKEDNNIDANDNNSLGDNSFILNNKNNNINNNNILNENNIDTSTSNNIHSSIFSKNNINEKNNNIEQSENNNIFNREEKIIQSNNIIHNDKENSLQNNIEKKDIDNSIDNNKPQNNINIFNNNKILLKSFGINIDESKIFNNNNNHLTDEGTVRLIIYINFLSQKFFLIDYPTLDQKRRALLNNVNANINNNENSDLNINNENSENNININNNEKQVQEEYLTLCNETIICKQNSYQMAADRILKSLSKPLNFQEFEEFLKNIEPKKLDELSLQIMTELNDELFKYDLDIMDINKTKEAYIFYLKIYIEQANKIYEQHEKMKNEEGNENNEENNIFIFQFMTLKIQMDDYLYEKYHIEDEHLKLLIKKYNLSIDNEISQLQTEFEEINEKFANDNKN